MFRDFSRFEIEDFAFDESFQKWVTGIDPAHDSFWEKYIEENPHQVDKILAARELVKSLKDEETETQPDGMADVIWGNIRAHIQKPRLFRSPQIAAAIALLVVSGCAYLWWSGNDPISPGHTDELLAREASKTSFTERINAENKVLDFTLADGSTVHLNSNSRISYPENFHSKERIIHLHGEAFFDIAKDPKRPFIIYANKTVIKVLGTSFRVKAYDDASKVVVSVESGKVSVFERKDFEKSREKPHVSGVVLMPNQQAEFSKELEKFSKTLVPEPLVVREIPEGEFDFDGTPLPVVFDILGKAYGIEILFNEDLVAGRLLKVSLEDETLFEKLDIICRTMGLNYHVVDATIIIENQ